VRRLLITLARRPGAAPVLVSAVIAPLACRTGLPEDDRGAGGAAASTASSSVNATASMTSSSTGFGPGPGSSSSGDDFCGSGILETFAVELPPPGAPADVGQLCGAPQAAVESNDSARITLTVGAEDHLATGFVEVPAGVLASVVGLPTVEAIEASLPSLLPVTIANVSPVAGGFTFDAAFPEPLAADPSRWARVTFRTTLSIDCAPAPQKTVQAITYVQLCDELGGVTWVSSGDDCNVCQIIAEMAPSPIVPLAATDALGLAVAIRLRVVEIARVGRARVLFAENDAGAQVTYRWSASGGTITELAPDTVLWEPPAGADPHQVQAAVMNDDGAAVASFLAKEVA